MLVCSKYGYHHSVEITYVVVLGLSKIMYNLLSNGIVYFGSWLKCFEMWLSCAFEMNVESIVFNDLILWICNG